MNKALHVTAPAVTQADLNLWYTLQEQLAAVKEQEMALRKKIFAAYFAHPKEGTNTESLADGWVIKGQFKIDRQVDPESLVTMRPYLTQEGISVDNLIKYKPELILPEYRKLSAEQMVKFDNILKIKPGSPSLEIVKPKRA
jgi:hypothetical protein